MAWWLLFAQTEIIPALPGWAGATVLGGFVWWLLYVQMPAQTKAERERWEERTKQEQERARLDKERSDAKDTLIMSLVSQFRDESAANRKSCAEEIKSIRETQIASVERICGEFEKDTTAIVDALKEGKQQRGKAS